jgi:hypothetical protein
VRISLAAIVRPRCRRNILFIAQHIKRDEQVEIKALKAQVDPLIGEIDSKPLL